MFYYANMLIKVANYIITGVLTIYYITRYGLDEAERMIDKELILVNRKKREMQDKLKKRAE